MTYEDSAALMQESEFRGRIKVSALKYADSIMGEPANTPAHSSRLRWANQTFQGPEIVAMQLQPPVVMDAAVQEAGVDANGKSQITDVALQGSVEAVVNKML